MEVEALANVNGGTTTRAQPGKSGVHSNETRTALSGKRFPGKIERLENILVRSIGG